MSFISKRGLLAAVAALVLGLGGAASSARASDYCCTYKKVTTYECVVCYETRSEAYTKELVCYDHCGRAYTKCVTCYRDVQVPVKKYVPVTKIVKVCY